MQNQDNIFPPSTLGSRIVPELYVDVNNNRTYLLTGDQGYKSAVCQYGANFGDYYFEVTLQQPKTPLPFVGVQPAIRVGFTVLEDQNLEMPLGATARSYAFNSIGRLITNALYDQATRDVPICKS